MPKKYPVGYIKDPAKVAAGQTRAKKSLRIDGRFTTNKFLDRVTQDAKATGVKEKDVFKYFEQHERVYARTYEKEMITTQRNGDQIKRDIRGYDGSVFKNGHKVKAATAIKAVAELNRYLRGEHDVVAFHLKPALSLNGKMNLKIPSVAEIRRRVEEGEELEDILDEYGITAISSVDKD